MIHMRKTIQKKHNQKKHTSVYRNALQLIAVGSVTGVFAGAIVTFFNILANKAEEIAYDGYAFLRSNPAFIPLLFLVLALGAFFIGVAAEISSVARGCGIPQAEGATRGAVRFRWFRDATATFAACLVSIFMGLSVGAEGPSVLIGACMGDGVASSTHRNEMIKRYQITGGACTGLAVASNAPLTGIIFAFEEAHKRFTPEVFVCAFSSVVFGVLTRSAIYQLFGMQIQKAFHSYVFNELPLYYYGYVILAGILCGGLGVLFHKLCFTMRSAFKKIKTKNPKIRHGLRILIAVTLGGVFSLLTTGTLGGGHGLIEAMGTHGGESLSKIESVLQGLGISVIWTLLFVLLLKGVITTVNVGSGLPCGIFIPIIAIGACVGGIITRFGVTLGLLNEKYCDILVMICMAAFFTTIVRAPLTAVIMICEFTGSFASLLPVIIAVSIGYTIGEMSKTEGIYEELLEAYERENGIHENAVREVYTLSVSHGALADKREVRDVLWPTGTRVKEIHRGEEVILPDGDTVLHHGDILTIVCKTDNPQKTKDDLVHILE